MSTNLGVVIGGRDDASRKSPRSGAAMPLARFFAIAVLAALTLSSCGDDSPTGNEYLIVDDKADPKLSPAALQSLRALQLPANRALIVAVTEFGPAAQVARQGDQLAKSLAEQCVDVDLCSKNGVFVLVDSGGGFPMVRVGSALRLDAYLAGVTQGPAYVSLQRRATQLPTEQQAEWLAGSVVEQVGTMDGESGWLGWVISHPSLFPQLAASFTTLLFPSDGPLDAPFVRPFLSLQVVERTHLGTWWFSILLISLTVFAARFLIGRLLRRFQMSAAWFRLPGAAMSLVCTLMLSLVSLPISYSMLAQSGARLEDAAELRSFIPTAPVADLLAQSWQPQRNLLLCVGLLVFGVCARAGMFLANPLLFMENSDQEAAVRAGLMPEWLTWTGSVDALPGLVGRTVALPFLAAVAAYGLLPGSLVVALLFSWAVQSPSAGFSVMTSVVTSKNLIGVLRGDVPQSRPSWAPRRQRTWIAGSTVLLGGALSLWAASLGGSASADSSVATSTVPSAQVDVPTPAFNPALGQWGDYPSRVKEGIGPFSEGLLVEYAQGVLRLGAGQAVDVSGSYDTATFEAVKALQTYVGIEPTGIIDAATWKVLDGIAEGGS